MKNVTAQCDLDIIASYLDCCGACKFYESSMSKPTESKNTWEAWFTDEDISKCKRFPPSFVGGVEHDKDDMGQFDSVYWQSPKVHAFTGKCGEYKLAIWLPKKAK